MSDTEQRKEVDLAQIQELLGNDKVPIASTATPIPLFGEQPEPAILLKKERLRHRLIADFLLEGMSHVDIAKQLNVTPAMVNYVANQPFVREYALGKMEQHSDKALSKLHEATEKAAEELIKLINDAENQEVKRKACINVLEFKYGKPNQPYSKTEKPAKDMSDDEIAKFLQN